MKRGGRSGTGLLAVAGWLAGAVRWLTIDIADGNKASAGAQSVDAAEKSPTCVLLRSLVCRSLRRSFVSDDR